METGNPSAEGLLGRLFSNGGPGQIMLYTIIQSIVSALLTPELAELQQGSLELLPNTKLSAEQAADMVNRHLADLAFAATEAQAAGIDAGRFARLVQAAGEAIAPMDAGRALRLSLIPEDSHDANVPGFRQAIQQGRIRDMWANTVRDLSRDYPTAREVVMAGLEAHLSGEEARSLYAALGGVPEYYDLMLHLAGTPPSPDQAATAARRGLIPRDGTGSDAVTYEQAFREGHWKNKWLDTFWQLSEYLPPPRTIVALVRAGAMDDATALKTLQQNGVSADMAASYVAEAHHTRTASERHLAKSDVETLYGGRAITLQQALDMLEALGYSVDDAHFLLELVDLHQLMSALEAAVRKISSLYVGHKIDRNRASTALDELGVAATQRDALLTTWTYERDANVRVLTEANVHAAVKKSILTAEQGVQRLVEMGYSADDAAILLQL